MPTISQKNTIFTFLALFLLVMGGAFLGPLSSARAAGMESGSILSLMNEARNTGDLSPLTANEALNRAAEAKAEDMIKNDYFAHTSPDGRTPWHWLKKAGYVYKYAGENLAVNYTDAEEQHGAWMNSKTHRENILNKNYQEVGIAMIPGKIGGENSYITVVFFGTPPLAGGAKNKAVPPLAEKMERTPLAPEVKGTEAKGETSSLETSPSPYLVPPVVSMPTIVTEHPWETRVMLSFLVISLTLLVSPAAFVFRAYLALYTIKLKKTLPIPSGQSLLTLQKEVLPQRFITDILPYREWKPP